MLVLFSCDDIINNYLKPHLGIVSRMSPFWSAVWVVKILFSVHLKKHCHHPVEEYYSFIVLEHLKAAGSQFSPERWLLSVCSFTCLIMFAWVSSGFCRFLPLSKNKLVGEMATMNCPYVWINVWVWWSAIDWDPIWGVFSCLACSQDRLQFNWDPEQDKAVR